MNGQRSESDNSVLLKILSNRTNFFEIILIAIVVGFAVNVIASGTLMNFQLSPLQYIIIGSVICIGALLFLLIKIVRGTNQFRHFEGFFIYDRKQNRLVEIPRYPFSEDLTHYFECGFSENKDLRTIWEKEPLKKSPPKTSKKPNREQIMFMLEERKKSPSKKIISEATEYFLLSKLSTHLTDYFNDEKFRKEKLQTFLREDIPDVLLKNRFLKLFSMPMDERSAFIDEPLGDSLERKGTILAMSKGGALYEKFDLLLPQGSTARRINEDTIEVETKRFIIRFTVSFDGFNTFIPSDFHRYYLGIDPKPEQIDDLLIIIDIAVIFKFGAFFSQTGWDYYKWVDSFLRSFDETFSENRFFESIGWNTALTAIKCLSPESDKIKKQKNPQNSD